MEEDQLRREPTSEQVRVASSAAQWSGAKRRKSNVISHPREVTAAVAAQNQIIKSKRDELAIAIRGMTDLSEQLAASYARQHVVIERLVERVNSLESRANGNGANASTEFAPALANGAVLDPNE